jgi:hypothetical protein
VIFELACTTCHGYGAFPPLVRNDCEDCQGTGVESHPWDETSSPRTLEDLEDSEDEERTQVDMTASKLIERGEFETIEQLILSGQMPDDRISALMQAFPAFGEWLRKRAAARQEQANMEFGGGL